MPKKSKWIIALSQTGLIIILFILMIALLNVPDVPAWPQWLLRNPVVSYFLRERADVKGQAAATTLNDLMPKSYGNLIRFQENSSAQIDSLSQYTFYYEKIAEYLPQSAAAYGTLGFCDFFEGRYDRSLVNYQKAVALVPQFFWFQYNLGVLNFTQGNYAEAAQAFQDALKTKPETALQFFYESKIYRDMLREHPDADQRLKAGLQKGYADSQKMLLLSSQYLKGIKMPKPEKIAPQLF